MKQGRFTAFFLRISKTNLPCKIQLSVGKDECNYLIHFQKFKNDFPFYKVVYAPKHTKDSIRSIAGSFDVLASIPFSYSRIPGSISGGISFVQPPRYSFQIPVCKCSGVDKRQKNISSKQYLKLFLRSIDLFLIRLKARFYFIFPVFIDLGR